MIRSVAINTGKYLKNEVADFNDSNLFILSEIPEDILNKKQFPLARIDDLQTVPETYASNQKFTEISGCQINVWVETNQELENLKNQIEEVLSTHQIECFFIQSDFDNEYQVHRLIMRCQKINYLRRI